jgi:uncharacterized protein
VPLVGLFSIPYGPLGEEFGWRGVLLPWLIDKWSPMRSAVVVGLIWAVWHAPLWSFSDFIPGVPPYQAIPLYVVSVVAFSVILTTLYLRSAGSVGVAMLAHGVFNATLLPFASLADDGALRSAAAWPFVAATVLTAFGVVLAARLRKPWVHAVTLER